MSERKITLAAARVNAGLQQGDVAKRIGVSIVTLNKWEKGLTLPRIDQARELANIYKMPLHMIFFARAT